MTIRKHTNNAATTLNGAITDVATSITVTSAADFPDISVTGEYNVTFGTGGTLEIVTVTSVAANVLTVTRGVEGTSGTAFGNGADVRLLTTADSLDRKCDLAELQDIDFSGASSFKLPSDAAPTVDATGKTAVDTTITDHTGLITYHDGTEALYGIAIPTGNLTTTDGHVIAYNATNNEFEMVAGGSGASLALDNLTGVAINTSLISDTDGTDDLGSTGVRWRVLYVDDITVTTNITVGGTVDGRDLATDGTKLDGVEALADVTDEANVVSSLDGATITNITVADGDKVLVQDITDSDNLKSVTALSIAQLAGGINDVLDDTTPQLGGNLDVNGNEITSIGGTDILVHSDNDINMILGDSGGVDDFNIKDSLNAVRASISSDGVATFDSTVNGRTMSTDGTKLDGIETAADVTDEANVVSSLDGATLSAVAVATGDKVVIQDVSDTDSIKTVTAQSIADLASGSGILAQEVFDAGNTAYGSASNNIPVDDTIPQNTEGSERMSVAITPASATNILYIEAQFPIVGADAARAISMALFQDSTANALAVSSSHVASSTTTTSLVLLFRMVSGTTSATTFKIRAGTDAGTAFFNGDAGARVGGGVCTPFLRVIETTV